jgi:hypothetical protein
VWVAVPSGSSAVTMTRGKVSPRVGNGLDHHPRTSSGFCKGLVADVGH